MSRRALKMRRGLVLALRGLVFVACACPVACGGAETETGADEQPNAPSGPRAEYDAYMNQANLAVAEERTQDALDAYLAAAQVLDQSGEVTVERAEAHFLAADVAYQRVNRDLAIEEYQKSIDIYLRFTGNSKIKAAVALTNMGVMYKEKADKNKARNCWEDALQLYKEAPPELQNKRNMEKIEQNIRDLDAGY
jgi:tetratricopeptide (TPR) repeat protein